MTRSTVRDASAKSAEATPESHVPRLRARVDTILLVCPGRLSWRHRARPSATLHEIQACPLGANWNVSFVPQRKFERKRESSEWHLVASQRSFVGIEAGNGSTRPESGAAGAHQLPAVHQDRPGADCLFTVKKMAGTNRACPRRWNDVPDGNTPEGRKSESKPRPELELTR